MKEKFIGKYMRLAKVLAKDSNPCLSRHVGVVVVDPSTNAIVGSGYNGPPENTPHCNDVEFLLNFFWPQLTEEEKDRVFDKCEGVVSPPASSPLDACNFISDCNICPRNFLNYNSGKRSELCSCQHAERNALNKLPIPAKGLIMFCWCGVPCNQCSGSIINAGIKEVHCLKTEDYHPTARWLYEKSNTNLFEYSEEIMETIGDA